MTSKFVTNVSMTVEATPGATINAVAKEIVEIAQRVVCNVECKFNDVKLIAGPDSDPDGLVAAYQRECESNRPYKIATAWR